MTSHRVTIDRNALFCSVDECGCMNGDGFGFTVLVELTEHRSFAGMSLGGIPISYSHPLGFSPAELTDAATRHCTEYHGAKCLPT